jgi:tetratricopeptide (TPR) repeat protein
MFFGTGEDCFAGPAGTYQQAEAYMKMEDHEQAKQLYQRVVDNWPEDYYCAPRAQAGVAKTNIALGNLQAAQAAVDKLLADYSNSDHIEWSVHHVAHHYKLFGQYEKAKQLYQHVLDNWPEDYYAMWAQVGLAESYLSLGNTQAAEAAIRKVLADYPYQLDIAGAVCNIAQYYHHQVGDFEKAKQYYQYIMDHWPQDDYAVWAQKGRAEVSSASPNEAAAQWAEIVAKVDSIMSDIAHDNMQAAEASINELLTDYPVHVRMAKVIYEIGKRWHQFGEYQKAKPLYQYVLDHWPGDYYAMWAQSGLAMSHVGLGELQAGQAAADALTANFQGADRIGEAVYDVALQYNRSGEYQKAKQMYQYVWNTWPAFKRITWTQIGLAQANIWLGEMDAAEAVIDDLVAKLAAEFPNDSDLPVVAAEGYYHAASYYRRVKEYEKSIACCQKIISGCPDYAHAWHAQFLIGRNYQNLKWAKRIPESEADAKTIDAYQQLLATYPDCPLAEEAQAEINRLTN